MKRFLILLFSLVFLFISFSSVLSAQDDQVFLSYRKKLMNSIAIHMGSIGDILKNNLPFKDQIALHARVIALNSKLIAKAFEKKITKGQTNAKQEIWQEWDKFKTAAMNLGRESEKLANMVESGNMSGLMSQVRNLGGACGGCHKAYRRKK